MKNLYDVINFIGILAMVPIFVGGEVSSKTPVLKQFEVDQYNNVIRPYERVDNKRSEMIVEDVKNLRLECHADYPVQWIYTGNGIPIINTDIALATSLSPTERGRDRFSGQYVASVFLGSLKERHTGRYQCSRVDYVTVTPNLQIYVPGQDLFISPQGKTIQIRPNVSWISLPCSVSDPRVKVSLFKLDGRELKRPVTKTDDAIIYDPRKGFRMNLKRIEDPEGQYICSAKYNNEYRDVEYTIASNSESAVSGNYEEFKQLPEETCTGESCKQCETHTDCPPMMHCYTDLKCRDPCEYSIKCGEGATCRLTDNRPQCYCPPGSIGDPTKECFNVSRERFERYERYP